MSNNDLAYSLQLPPHVVFGWGQRTQLPSLCHGVGARAIVVWGSRTLAASEIGKNLFAALQAADLSPIQFSTCIGEPTVDDIDRATNQLRQLPVKPTDFLLAIGGGSAIDTAKALAAMATNTHGTSVRDFLEGVGTGLTLSNPPLPIVAVPTTSGTGSEATKNAVISVADPPVKKSLRHPGLIPQRVLVDPQLTVSCPAAITAESGMDAITQCIESYVSRWATPMSQLLARDGLVHGLLSIVNAIEQPDSRSGRTGMAHAALMSGMALANSGLGLAHGVAAALGAIANVPHGLACAVMLPAAIRVNLTVSQQQFAELEWALCDVEGRPRFTQPDAARAFSERIGNISQRLSIPSRLGKLGVTPNMIPALVSGSHGNSLNGNPRSIDDAELTTILEQQL
jgi:alcohol dehydrogenase class IV